MAVILVQSNVNDKDKTKTGCLTLDFMTDMKVKSKHSMYYYQVDEVKFRAKLI